MSDAATELDVRLDDLLVPSGDPEYRLHRAQALDWLLRHADAAHPRLMELANIDEPPGLVLEALAEFSRPESVPLMERALRLASDATTAAAASALGRHGHRSAGVALERALADSRDQVVASAVEGLAARGDIAGCRALSRLLTHRNREIRERAARARQALGCR